MVGRFFMLKKIFAVFFAGIFFAMGANAAIDPRTTCVKKNAAVDNYIRLKADYAIYFDNDNSNIPAVCQNEINQLVTDLEKNKTDIETVLLFGSTDSTGSNKYNIELAQKRVSTIETLLKDNNVPVCISDESGNITSQRCARMSMGESFAMLRNSNNTSSSNERAVFMFVIYKGDICDASTIDALNRLSEKVSDPSIKSLLNDATKICNNDKKDQLLLRSQREQIMAAISAAIEKYPELSEGMPAGVLADAIIAIRDSLALSVSVWKNAEGEFNYARLASDSIAGVVLGTAGGLITSSVVKKNQIKNGFEDIMCTVGGQNVANWGDEFRVGIK